MMKTEDKTIGETTYRTTQFGARKGDKLFARVVNMIGPMLASAFAAVGGQGVTDNRRLSEMEVDKLGKALAGASHLDPDEFSRLMIDLLELTCIGERPITGDIYDSHFAGNYGEKFRVVAWVIEFNFGSIFGAGGIGGLIALLKTKAPSANRPAPSTKT